VLVQGVPQLGDHGGQCRAGDERIRPDAIADELLGDHVRALAQQQLEQAEGLGADAAVLSVAQELPRPPIENEVAECD
jgi:hypothetical protein